MEAPRRRVSWLLVVSLCLNVALIAGIAVVVYRIAHPDLSVGSGGPLAPRSLIAQFPDDGAAIQRVIDAHSAKIQQLRHASATARRQAARLVASPGYTPQAMAAAFDRVVQADNALIRENVAMMNESLATLSPAERKALIDKLRRRGRFFRTLRQH